MCVFETIDRRKMKNAIIRVKVRSNYARTSVKVKSILSKDIINDRSILSIKELIGEKLSHPILLFIIFSCIMYCFLFILITFLFSFCTLFQFFFILPFIFLRQNIFLNSKSWCAYTFHFPFVFQQLYIIVTMSINFIFNYFSFLKHMKNMCVYPSKYTYILVQS